jgi:uncharacterized damage-inducible protein DinB/GNAT superfamily N-acetyltransferase
MNHEDSIEIRPLAVRDSLDALTALLHRAYAPLAAAGMNFTAATQTAQDTARRAAEGQCFVALLGRQPVGTVTVAGPYDESIAPWATAVPWFRDRDTAHLHQFAVDTSHQRQGLGRRLVATCEQWARERGYRLMALDTAEPAADLRAMYRRLGYADVGHVQWEGKAYRSVVMRKALDTSPLRAHLATMARYNLWATQRLVAHVDALPEAEYRRDAGLFFKSVHGTLAHLLVAEHLLWFQRFAHGQSPAMALNSDVEPDRARLRQRLLEGAAAWLPLLDDWPEERLASTLRFTRTTGEAAALPFAATLGHVFNHGTHHRGQVTAALTAMGRPCPELDLAWMLQAESKAR